MQASVLVVEDTPEMAELVGLYLSKEGCRYTLVGSAEEGLERLQSESYDLLVLDIQLPGMDGFEFLTQLRKSSALPVLVLTARSQDEDLILSLGLGADDFLPKPFSPRVLAARCRALLRRGSAGSGQGNSRELRAWGDFQLRLDTRELTKNGVRIPLSAREFELLRFFLDHPRKAFLPQELYDTVWKNEYGDLSAVGVYIQRLRRKIEPNPLSPVFLRTERGFGYLFQPDRGE